MKEEHMATKITDSAVKDRAIYHLAKRIALMELGPSATEEELKLKAVSLSKKNLGFLFDLFVRSAPSGPFPETRADDFCDWYFAERAALQAA